MTHAFDRRINIGNDCADYWLRITVNRIYDKGEPIIDRAVFFADEETGAGRYLTEDQVTNLILALQDARELIK